MSIPLEAWIVGVPLLTAVLAGCGGRLIGARGAQIVTCLGMIVTAVLACVLAYQACFEGLTRTWILAPWIRVGDFSTFWAIRVDALSAIMMATVTLVSACVHVYSIGYMAHDSGVPRFMAYLSLFTFFMLLLVGADDLMQMFVGWEGVGLCSYLLIGFWYHKDSACAAAIKAFLVNRVGDIGFALGIMACFAVFRSVRLGDIFASAASMRHFALNMGGMEIPALTVICILLFLGAMGKSAQLGLHTWLPDAMEGPTPVSALIHAATMVTAGVFMVARLSPLFEQAPVAQNLVLIVGTLTAILAATMALVQTDIKRVIAYSTMSQLGYMFMALGVSAYGAGMFHLVTHAFFKALLFLGAGAVIHALNGEQDLRRMGGLGRSMRITCGLMGVGVLALAGIGVPGLGGFAGFYSKEAILQMVVWGPGDSVGFGLRLAAYVIGVLTALLTAIYGGRLMMLAFYGAKGRGEASHAHDAPAVMLWPMIPLGLGAVLAGWALEPFFVGKHPVWGKTLIGPVHDTLLAAHDHIPLWVGGLPLLAGLLGLALAFVLYGPRPEWPQRILARFAGVHRLLLRGYGFDDAYQALIVSPCLRLGRMLWHGIDQDIIDRFGPEGVATRVNAMGTRFAAFHRGLIGQQAMVMIFGVILCLILVEFWVRR
ncbi:MAG: NADH-quinone oxidoreductase subunit L [Alphaproteobacteria bacterium]|nr:MAG: NADH-quinone oxidoreductase subunit L [Alphaproteobacteria bacterium]